MRRARFKHSPPPSLHLCANKHPKHLGISLSDVQPALRILASLHAKSISNPVKHLQLIRIWTTRRRKKKTTYMCRDFCAFTTSSFEL